MIKIYGSELPWKLSGSFQCKIKFKGKQLSKEGHLNAGITFAPGRTNRTINN